MSTTLPPPYLANPNAPAHSVQGALDTGYLRDITAAPNATWGNLDQDTLIAAAFQKIRDQLVEKRVLLKPFLQDFDRTKTGHITRDQFQRALGMLCIALPRRGLDVSMVFLRAANPAQALMDLYGTPRFPGSFNYRAFLDTLNQDELLATQSLTQASSEAPLR